MYKNRSFVLALIAIISLMAGMVVAPVAAAPRARIDIIRLGNAADAAPALIGPSTFLQGNGAPGTTAFQAHIDQVASAPLDIVVLAASFPTSGSSTPECDALMGLSNVNSCTTVTLTRASDANNASATAAINKAEIVYFAGGDQCNYVGWKGSSVYTAVKNVVARGGGVGGGSAGLAIQGDYVYDACVGSVLSTEALANPYHRYITFTYDFFKWPNLGQTITDTHFEQRDRMGRLMAFVARQVKDGKTAAAYGVGVNEDTTLLVDKNGLGKVYGDAAYIVLADHTPEQCVSKKPLTYSNFKIWKLTDGQTFDFKNRPASGFYLRSVTNGVIAGDPYVP